MKFEIKSENKKVNPPEIKFKFNKNIFENLYSNANHSPPNPCVTNKRLVSVNLPTCTRILYQVKIILRPSSHLLVHL